MIAGDAIHEKLSIELKNKILGEAPAAEKVEGAGQIIPPKVEGKEDKEEEFSGFLLL